MFPTFHGRIEGGKLQIAELEQNPRVLEGKHIAIVPLDLNDKAQVVGGSVVAGIYQGSALNSLRGKEDLDALEGKPVMVIIRHEIVSSTTADVFSPRFQLGTKPVEMDD